MDSTTGTTHVDLESHGYDAFRRRLQYRFLQSLAHGPLFTTDADRIFETYLDALPEHRQHYTCHACRRFFDTFGGLVIISADGHARPAMWDVDDANPFFQSAVERLARLVARAEVTGVFLSSAPVWGQPVTGPWSHFAVTPPAERTFRHALLTAGQAMAEKLEDYRNIQRALAEFTRPMLDQAMTLLESDALYRAEKVIGPARFLRNLHAARDAVRGPARDNVTWRAVATAPAGFCHPRSSMIGTLLEDIAAGTMGFDDISRRFAAKMHPLQYQRPQAAPSAGNIAEAEKIVAKLGIARSLERRFARVEEVEALWRPAPVQPEQPDGGVFSHLKPKGQEPAPAIAPPARTMTWEKFRREVLPTAETITCLAPHHSISYAAFVTAVHADAPPILQWDSEEHRNPVSWYFWMGGSPASQWGLPSGQYVPVSAICLKPSQWGPNPDAFPHKGRGVMFCLEGARESRISGNALFPESLRSELRAVRSTIEAYARSATIEGKEGGSACGVLLQQGAAWDARFRVKSAGVWMDYRLDRWD